MHACPSAVTNVFDKTQGSILQRGINRLLGTLGAAVYSCIVIGLIYAINGGSYDNTPAKSVRQLHAVQTAVLAVWTAGTVLYRAICDTRTSAGCPIAPFTYTHIPRCRVATVVVLMALYGGFIGVNKNRHPRFAYGWTVLMLTVPVIVLEDFKEDSPWGASGWRCVSGVRGGGGAAAQEVGVGCRGGGWGLQKRWAEGAGGLGGKLEDETACVWCGACEGSGWGRVSPVGGMQMPRPAHR